MESVDLTKRTWGVLDPVATDVQSFRYDLACRFYLPVSIRTDPEKGTEPPAFPRGRVRRAELVSTTTYAAIRAASRCSRRRRC